MNRNFVAFTCELTYIGYYLNVAVIGRLRKYVFIIRWLYGKKKLLIAFTITCFSNSFGQCLSNCRWALNEQIYGQRHSTSTDNPSFIQTLYLLLALYDVSRFNDPPPFSLRNVRIWEILSCRFTYMHEVIALWFRILFSLLF